MRDTVSKQAEAVGSPDGTFIHTTHIAGRVLVSLVCSGWTVVVGSGVLSLMTSCPGAFGSLRSVETVKRLIKSQSPIDTVRRGIHSGVGGDPSGVPRQQHAAAVELRRGRHCRIDHRPTDSRGSGGGFASQGPPCDLFRWRPFLGRDRQTNYVTSKAHSRGQGAGAGCGGSSQNPPAAAQVRHGVFLA